MTTGSNLVPVKRELTSRLRDHPDLDGVQVQYAEDARRMSDETLYFARTADIDQEWAATGAPNPRTETITLSLFVRVTQHGAEAEAVEDRAAELVAVVAELVGLDPQLSHQVRHLLKVVVAGVAPETWVDDDAAYSEWTVRLQITSYLR